MNKLLKRNFTEFTSEMKKTHTILIPDIFPTHMELIVEIFRLNGYKAEVLKSRGRQVLDTGLKYLHNDMCYPAICAVGQQLHALLSGDFDPKKTALIQFQTGGGCRASNYIMLLRKALANMKMSYVPVISLNFGGYEKHSGFRVTPKLFLEAFYALVYGDMLLLLKNQCIPYEIKKGETKDLTNFWVKRLTGDLSKGRGMSERSLFKNLSAMAADFHGIKREKKEITKVGIVGEIYVKYSPFGNNGLEEFLLSQGCEYMVPGVLGFFQAFFKNSRFDFEYYGGSFAKTWASGLILRKLSRFEKLMKKAAKPYEDFTLPLDFDEVEKLSEEIIDHGVKMGEGWLLPGEIAELIKLGYGNVICAQPFGCLPNHIVGKGTARRIRELYPEANIFPVDYDAGASKVNQENRIKLMLAIAGERGKK